MSDPTETLALTIKRQFAVAPELVFDTFTNPKLMVVWWGSNVEFAMDLRVDGTWTITRNEGEMQYVATGVYTKVDRPTHLEYTYTMPQFSPNADLISIHIEATSGGCNMTFTQSGEDIHSELVGLADGEASASEQGWQQGFDLMQAAWTKMQSS